MGGGRPSKGGRPRTTAQGQILQSCVEKGAQLCRHTNTPESAQAILRRILKNEPLVLKIQHELIDQGKDIRRTGAGAELNREIREVVEKYQREIRELEERVRQAIEERDEESWKELEKRGIQDEMEKLRRDSAKMESKLEKARR